MLFLGVLRDRLGASKDKFFATVLLGSGLVFLGMLFVAASAISGLVVAASISPNTFSETLVYARIFPYVVMHVSHSEWPQCL